MRRWPNGQYKYETALWAHGDAYERTSAAELTRIAAEGRLFVAVAAGDAVPVASAALGIARPCGGSGGDVDERAGRFVAAATAAAGDGGGGGGGGVESSAGDVGGYVEIGMLAVRPAYAGRGVGGRLVAAIAAWAAAAAGVAAVRVHAFTAPDDGGAAAALAVPPEKARLRAWYTGKLGFRPVARVPVAAAYPALVAAGLHPGIVIEVLECPIAAPGVAPPGSVRDP